MCKPPAKGMMVGPWIVLWCMYGTVAVEAARDTCVCQNSSQLYVPCLERPCSPVA
jgi:hypothetical protein